MHGGRDSGITLMETAATISVMILVASTLMIVMLNLFGQSYNSDAVRLLTNVNTYSQGYYVTHNKNLDGLNGAILHAQLADVNFVTSEPPQNNQVGFVKNSQAVIYDTYDQGTKGCLYVGDLYEGSPNPSMWGNIASINGPGIYWASTPNYACQLNVPSGVSWTTNPSQSVGYIAGTSTSSSSSSSGGGSSSTTSSTAVDPTYQPGNLYGWGSNSAGQVGNGQTTTAVGNPVNVVGPGGVGSFTGAVSVASGDNDSYAVSSGGHVWGWGSNSSGQLGDGSSSSSSTPVEVKCKNTGQPLSNIVSVSAAGSWAMAVDGSGNVWEWGQTPEGTDDEAVQVSGLSNIVGVSMSSSNGLALDNDGHSWCWGDDSKGQCGYAATNIPTTNNIPKPVEMRMGNPSSATMGDITSISEGDGYTTCISLGHVYSWGDNSDGQLGVPNVTQSSDAVEATSTNGSGSMSNMAEIKDGPHHVVALDNNGNVYAWGDNSNGQSGAWQQHSYQPAPLPNQNGNGQLSGAIDVTAGQGDSYAASPNTVYGCGSNNTSQLTNWGGSSTSVPVTVAVFSNVQHVTYNHGHVETLD